MPPATRALLEGLIDYAGLFPPAALALAPAVANHAQYQTGPEAWMLGRFIVPAARLHALAEHADRFASGPPWRVSVLGLAPADGEAWGAAARRTLAAARAFDRDQGGTTACDRFELKLPPAAARDADGLSGTLSDLDGAYREESATPPRAALEVPYLDAPDAVGPAAHAVAEANGRAGRPAFALKFRCGGVTPDLVPDPETLAGAIATALRAGAPFKATAGLHHPLPTHDDSVGARMYGFLGVFGGAALARAHGLGPDDLAEILVDADPSAWSADDRLHWRSLAVSAADLAAARRDAALSFGSCSFDEPRDDLRALGWL